MRYKTQYERTKQHADLELAWILWKWCTLLESTYSNNYWRVPCGKSEADQKKIYINYISFLFLFLLFNLAWVTQLLFHHCSLKLHSYFTETQLQKWYTSIIFYHNLTQRIAPQVKMNEYRYAVIGAEMEIWALQLTAVQIQWSMNKVIAYPDCTNNRDEL